MSAAAGTAMERSETAEVATGSAAGLHELLAEVATGDFSRRELANRIVRAIAGAIALKAVAILGYDRRRQRLVLLAEHGLPAEGRTSLEGKAQRTWDIPLRGLRNRRISVIEAAHQNPFVPPGLVALAPAGLTIASIPIYYDFQPAGVLLLFAGGAGEIRDPDLHSLSLGLRACARGLRDSHAAREAAEPEAAPEVATQAEDTAETARRPPLHAIPGSRDRRPQPAGLTEAERLELAEVRLHAKNLQAEAHRLARDLDQAREHLDQKTQTAAALSASRQALARERDALLARVAELEREQQTGMAELRRQVAALDDRVLASESERVRHQRAAETARAALQAAERERDAAAELLRAGESAAAGMQAGFDALRADRDRLAAGVESLTEQLRGTLAFLDEAQVQVARELAALAADRSAWEAEANDWQARAAQGAEDRLRLEHELRTATARGEVAQERLAGARQEIARLAEVNDELAPAVAQAEAARAAAVAELAALRRTVEQEREGNAQTEHALRAELAAVRAESDRLGTLLAARDNALAERESEIARRAEQLAAFRREQHALQETIDRLRQSNQALEAGNHGLASEIAEARTEAQRLAREHAGVQEQLVQVVAGHAETDAARTGELQQVRQRLAAAESERSALQAERSSLQSTLAAAEARLEQAEAERAEMSARLEHGAGVLDDQLEALSAERAALLERAAQLETALAGERRRATEESQRAAALADQAERALEAGREAATRDAELVQELAQARDMAERRESELTALLSERSALQEAVAAAETRIEAAQAARKQAEARLEQTAGSMDQQAAALSAERTALLDRLAQVERSAAAERERAERESRRVEGLTERINRLQKAAREASSRQAELAGELAHARSEIEVLRQHSEDRGVVARQAADLQARAAELDRLLAAARDEAGVFRAQLAQAEQQRAALAKGIQTAHREQSRQAAALAEERENAQAALGQLAALRERADAERARQMAAMEAATAAHAAAAAELQSRLDQLHEEQARLAVERDRQAESAQAERDAAERLRQENQAIARRLEEETRRIEELGGLLRQRDTELERAAAERLAFEETVQGAEGALAELRREYHVLRRQLDAAAKQLEDERSAHAQALAAVEQARAAGAFAPEAHSMAGAEKPAAEPPAATPEAPLVIERSAPAGVEVNAPPPPAAAAAGAGQDIVLLDEGTLSTDACVILRDAGVGVAALPVENAAETLARRRVGCIVLNLASGPPAWHTLKALRERMGTRDVPILAYAMSAQAPTGFSFGRADFALWPIDAGRLIERLSALRPKLKRVLVASHDVEGMGRLREPLARARLSATFVLDGKQARDLAASTQPDAVVLHLSPSCQDIARGVASFRAANAASHVPLLILLDKAAPQREDAFIKATVRELLRAGTFDFSQLATELERLRA